MLPKKGVRVIGTHLDGVAASDVRQVGVHTRVGQLPLLRDGLGPDRPEIRKEVAARIVVVSIMPDVGSEIEDSVRADDAGERRLDV